MGVDGNIDLDDDRQAEIRAMDDKVDSPNLFDFLGVQVGATPEDVRAAFRDASRRFHPDRFYGKNLGPFRLKLERIFKRLVEANQILTDPAKRDAYLAANPVLRAVAQKSGTGATPAVQPRTADEEARDAERRARLARHPYLAKISRVREHMTRARELVAKEDFSQAFSLLNAAVQMDPQNNDVKVLLAEVRINADLVRAERSYKHALEALDRQDPSLALQALKTAVAANPSHFKAAHKAAQLLERAGEIKEATSFAQKAVEAAPKEVDYRIHLAELLEGAGMKVLARKHFAHAQRLDPAHPEVKKHGKKFWPF